MNLYLNDIDGDLAKDTNRAGFGRGLLKAGQKDPRVVALCADLTESTNVHLFAQEFPERFVEVGIAEQNMVTVAAGLAAMGKIPFASSYAAFNPGRNWEQIKTTAAINDQPVKVIGAHAGLHTGPDGATHQMLEDIALMRVMPNMTVIVPGDAIEAEKVALALAADDTGPGYVRLCREAIPILTTEKTPFEIGKAYVYTPGKDLTLISTGVLTYQALLAAEMLYKDGIDVEVIHCPTIKPLDAVTILHSIQKTGLVMTLEEAQIAGGLGGAVAELLSEELPTKLKRLGVRDRYGESGKPEELLNLHGLTAKHIVLSVHELVRSR